jgi:hypothetical protein
MILVSGQRKYFATNGFANTLTGVAVNRPEHKCLLQSPLKILISGNFHLDQLF